MGNCASCLGRDRDRHSSQDSDLERILNEVQPSYGAFDGVLDIQPDEDDLRREREALEHITSRAGDFMIDVRNTTSIDLDHEQPILSHGLFATLTHAPFPHSTAFSEVDVSAEETEWLDSLQAVGDEQPPIQREGTLAMNMNLLRDVGSSKFEHNI